jgi:hypothetical protein
MCIVIRTYGYLRCLALDKAFQSGKKLFTELYDVVCVEKGLAFYAVVVASFYPCLYAGPTIKF